MTSDKEIIEIAKEFKDCKPRNTPQQRKLKRLKEKIIEKSKI